jgi:probable addiction module antidote protein
MEGAKMKIKTTPWIAADHLENEEDMAGYLQLGLDEGDPALVALMLGDIAQAKGLNEIARQTGLSRATLDKALSSKEEIDLRVARKVVRALGSEIQVNRPKTKRSFDPFLVRVHPTSKASRKKVAGG